MGGGKRSSGIRIKWRNADRSDDLEMEMKWTAAHAKCGPPTSVGGRVGGAEKRMGGVGGDGEEGAGEARAIRIRKLVATSWRFTAT